MSIAFLLLVSEEVLKVVCVIVIYVSSIRSGVDVDSPSHLHHIIKPGTLKWPFSFKLPDNLPPDYVSKYGSEILYK